MRVVNNLTNPGDIRRVDLAPDTIRIQISGGQERIYRISTEMTVSCAWCSKAMGTKDGQGVSGVSHSICPECYAKELARNGVQK